MPDGGGMTDNERATAYMTLSKQYHEQYDQRRTLEWKIHVALWGLLAGGGYALATQAKDPKIGSWSLVAVVVAVLVVHFIWAVKMHTGEDQDQELSIHYRKCAESLLRKGSGEQAADDAYVFSSREGRLGMPERLRSFFRPYWFWLGIEMATTLFVAVAAYRLAVYGEPRASAASVADLQSELKQARYELTQLSARLAVTESRISSLPQIAAGKSSPESYPSAQQVKDSATAPAPTTK